MCGCTLPGELHRDTALGEEKLVYESSLSQAVPQETKPEEEAVYETAGEAVTKEQEDGETFSGNLPAEGEVTVLTEEEKAQLMREQQNLYAFSMLEVTQQNLYAEILYALTNYVEEMEVSTLDTKEIDTVFQCVLLDHPEIFYTDGYTFVKYTLGDEIKRITFSGTYIYDRQEREELLKQIEAAVSSVVSGIAPEASDYDKIKYIYETVIEGCEYRLDARDNQNICSVFLYGSSVCQGYAKAVQLLCGRMGIPATLVTGTVDNGEGHAWNLVRIDGEWYHLDATWGDAFYLFEESAANGGELQTQVPEINYDYLCVTTDQIGRTHTISHLLPLPECSAMENNYYVKDGAYFVTADMEQFGAFVMRCRQEGRESVTIKCSTDEVYDELLSQLIGQQLIFHYLEPVDGSIMYTDSKAQLSLTFWL